MKLCLRRSIIITLFIAILVQCTMPGPDVPKPGVVFSFDVEGYVPLQDLYERREMIQTLDVPFTFYVRSPDLLTPEQADMLKTLEQDGHEIAWHTRFHTDAIDYILIQEHSIEEYAEYEIIPGIEDFRNNGIIIKNFAYPVAHHFTELDDYLLENFFDSLRSASAVIDWCFYKMNDSRIVSAYWIDNLDIVSVASQMEDICNALRTIKRKRYVLNLYGHNIDVDTQVYSTPFDKLQAIVQYARSLDLEFYRMKDLF